MEKPLEPDKHSPLWPLALLGILVSALSLSSSKHNPPRESVHPHHRPARKDESAQREPPLVSDSRPTSPNDSAERSKKRTPFWQKLPVWIALGLLIVNFFQMRATQVAVDKSREANDLNREGLYSVQRAFITSTKPTTELARYDVINGVRQKKPLKMIEFTSHWENVGNTPAIGVVTAVGKVEQPDEITEQQFLATQADRTAARSAMGPKAILDSGTLRDDETFLTDNPSVPRFMWGWIVYRDAFPKTKTHVTEWCWKITEITWKLDDNGKRTDKPHLTASACVHHNCVDEFCEDYANITTVSPAH